MSDTPNHPDQNLQINGSNAAQPYMTDAVIAGGTSAARDQSAIERDLNDENGDPLFTNPQDSRDKSKADDRAPPDRDLEYKQGGDTSDENGDPLTPEVDAADQSKPLDERLSGNQR